MDNRTVGHSITVKASRHVPSMARRYASVTLRDCWNRLSRLDWRALPADENSSSLAAATRDACAERDVPESGQESLRSSFDSRLECDGKEGELSAAASICKSSIFALSARSEALLLAVPAPESGAEADVE